MKNKIDKNKEYLAEIVSWGEKTLTGVLPRYGRRDAAAPNPAPAQAAEYETLRVKIAAWEKLGSKFLIEDYMRGAALERMEIQAVYIMLFNHLVERRSTQISDLLRVLAQLNGLPPTAPLEIFQSKKPLFASGICNFSQHFGGGLPLNIELQSHFLSRAIGIKPVLKKKPVPENLTAKEIYQRLSERVIGQEDAKKRVSSAVFRHLKATQLNLLREPAERIQKANILIIGPTGTGKTHIARTLAGILKVPLTACDATQYTESGYVGMNVEDILVQALKNCGGRQDVLAQSIIYIDEVDKIASRDSRASHYTTKDVSGLSVQQELLKMLDGDKVSYTRRTTMSEGDYEFSVGGLLFVAGGAFQGLEEVVKERLNRKAAIGFNGSVEAERAEEALRDSNWLNHIITEDLITYGFLPEFIGRFSSIVTLNPLEEGDVLEILTKPKNSLLSQYNALLEAAGVQHKFGEADLRAVAHEAFELKTGARGLKSIMEARVAPLLFDATGVTPPPDGKAA